jgi:hypothetical protein
MALKIFLSKIIDLLESYSEAITIITIFIGGVWSFFKFKEYLKDRRFGIYHELIKELVEPESPDKPLKLDRQIAIIYELRNFPEYYEVSKRILKGLRENWEDKSVQRAIQEIDISLEYMESNRICRLFWRLFKK